VANSTVGSPRRLRRLAGVVGGVAASALALSFAWSVVGGALRPATIPTATSIVIAATGDPVAPPLPVPHRKPVPSRATVKFAGADTKQSPKKAPPTEKVASASAPSTARAEASSASKLAAPASSLLRTESKASRTRGQPEQE